MGMFDNVKCDYPLPVADTNGLSYQTKDFDCQMDTYHIRADGSLWRGHDRGPYSREKAQWILDEWIDVPRRSYYDGRFEFYSTIGRDGWIRWEVEFRRGDLERICLKEFRPEPVQTTTGM